MVLCAGPRSRYLLAIRCAEDPPPGFRAAPATTTIWTGIPASGPKNTNPTRAAVTATAASPARTTPGEPEDHRRDGEAEHHAAVRPAPTPAPRRSRRGPIRPSCGSRPGRPSPTGPPHVRCVRCRCRLCRPVGGNRATRRDSIGDGDPLPGRTVPDLMSSLRHRVLGAYKDRPARWNHWARLAGTPSKAEAAKP